MEDFNQAKIKRKLLIDAKAVGIPSGAAEDFINHSIADATKALSSKTIITESDLQRALVKELKKYHPDLAYVYQNHDKII